MKRRKRERSTKECEKIVSLSHWMLGATHVDRLKFERPIAVQGVGKGDNACLLRGEEKFKGRKNCLEIGQSHLRITETLERQLVVVDVPETAEKIRAL